MFSETVSAFAVDGSGSLTPLTFATGNGPSSIAVATEGTGNHIYVANNGGTNDVTAFLVDLNTGLLTPVAGSPFPVGANPMTLAIVMPGNGSNLLYTANPDATNPSISGFYVDSYSGALTPLSGSPFHLAVQDIATDPEDFYLYVATGNDIVGYRPDSTTGLLAPLTGFPVVTSTGAHSMTFDTTNPFLYVTNDGSADVSGSSFDAGTGELSPMTGSHSPPVSCRTPSQCSKARRVCNERHLQFAQLVGGECASPSILATFVQTRFSREEDDSTPQTETVAATTRKQRTLRIEFRV